MQRAGKTGDNLAGDGENARISAGRVLQPGQAAVVAGRIVFLYLAGDLLDHKKVVEHPLRGAGRGVVIDRCLLKLLVQRFQNLRMLL